MGECLHLHIHSAERANGFSAPAFLYLVHLALFCQPGKWPAMVCVLILGGRRTLRSCLAGCATALFSNSSSWKVVSPARAGGFADRGYRNGQK